MLEGASCKPFNATSCNPTFRNPSSSLITFLPSTVPALFPSIGTAPFPNATCRFQFQETIALSTAALLLINMGRTKNLKRSRRDDDGDEEEEHALSDQGAKSSSKSNSNKKAKTSGDSGKDGDGNPFWAVSLSCPDNIIFFNANLSSQAGW